MRSTFSIRESTTPLIAEVREHWQTRSVDFAAHVAGMASAWLELNHRDGNLEELLPAVSYSCARCFWLSDTPGFCARPTVEIVASGWHVVRNNEYFGSGGVDRLEVRKTRVELEAWCPLSFGANVSWSREPHDAARALRVVRPATEAEVSTAESNLRVGKVTTVDA